MTESSTVRLLCHLHLLLILFCIWKQVKQDSGSLTFQGIYMQRISGTNYSSYCTVDLEAITDTLHTPSPAPILDPPCFQLTVLLVWVVCWLENQIFISVSELLVAMVFSGSDCYICEFAVKTGHVSTERCLWGSVQCQRYSPLSCWLSAADIQSFHDSFSILGGILYKEPKGPVSSCSLGLMDYY